MNPTSLQWEQTSIEMDDLANRTGFLLQSNWSFRRISRGGTFWMASKRNCVQSIKGRDTGSSTDHAIIRQPMENSTLVRCEEAKLFRLKKLNASQLIHKMRRRPSYDI